MLSRLLRTSARRTALARRHASTKASDVVKPPSHAFPSASGLPPAKMRALISLYHKADGFITPETLSERIDDAFIHKPMARSYTFSEERKYADLWDELIERRALPKIGDGKSMLRKTSSMPMDGRRQWSSSEDVRENAAKNALYGIVDSGKPGLEVLEEEHERIQDYIKKDKEAQQKAAPGSAPES